MPIVRFRADHTTSPRRALRISPIRCVSGWCVLAFDGNDAAFAAASEVHVRPLPLTLPPMNQPPILPLRLAGQF